MVLGIMRLHHPGPGGVVGGGDTFSWRPIGSQGPGDAELFGELVSGLNRILRVRETGQPWWTRRHRQHLALVGAHQLPAALVRHPVVPVAKQDHVREIGLAAVCPVDDVVGIAPRCGPLATWPLAMTVAGVEAATRGAGDHATGPAHVDDD